jgi:prepilin-type processing-associated H-X9-DG protein
MAALDAQSLLVAPDYFLRNLVQAKQAPAVNNFAAAFAAADQGDDLLLMVDIQPLRALIGLVSSQAQIPPELTSAKQLPNLVRFIELRANFSRPAATSLIVTANNEADAEQIITISNEMKQLVAAKWAMEAQKLLANEDPVQQAAGRYSLRMSRLLDERIQLQREGDRLVMFRANLNGQGANPLMTASTIGVLVGLLLPAVQAAREAARRNASINNMKNIILASLNYEAKRKTYPPHASYDATGKPLLSWRVHLLPLIEQQALYENFHLDEPWDSPHNSKLIAEMPELYLDPSSGIAASEGKTHYLAVVGDQHLIAPADKGRMVKQITDGSSNTIAFVQVGNASAVTWTKPEDWQPDENNLMKPFDMLHPGGFIVAFADGSIRFLGYDIDPNVFKALLTYAGDEPIDSNSF